MAEHALYVNLGENRWLIARCSCGCWQRERMLRLGDRVADLLRPLEEEFDRHAGAPVEIAPPYTPALPAG